MFKILHGNTHGLPDVLEFLKTLENLENHPNKNARELFDLHEELIITRAPGRLDVMGGIADYSGSLVLETPIQEAALVALQHDSERIIRIVSPGGNDGMRSSAVEISLTDFEENGSPLSYQKARALFTKNPADHWAAYIAGAFLVLMREMNIDFPNGARLFIHSDVPEGKGVSSSAALEVAAMQAIAAAYNIMIEPIKLAALCQKVENLVVGAPCGIMDQITSACGQAHQLLVLLCQPADLQGFVNIPPELAVWGIDSGIRHSVSGRDYSAVRIGAFMGYRIIADVMNFNVQFQTADEPVVIEDNLWNGHLANISPSGFEMNFAHHLPEEMEDADFQKKYGTISDDVTKICPEQSYAVLKPTAHPIYEHFRVRVFRELLNNDLNMDTRVLLGELMYQSHASYSMCGLGSAGTDRLVQLVHSAGPEQGLYGAKITGGGNGGTVAVLGDINAEQAVHKIAYQYQAETGHNPFIFNGSSIGAGEFGWLKVKRS